MDRLIGGFVDIASIEAGRLAVTLEPGDPTLVAMEAVEIFHAQASALGVSLTTEMELPPSVVIFDPSRILQVLTNLLSNAMKFTPAQGRVAVRLWRVGDIVRFAVSDTGMGVPTDQLEAVFERFVQLTKNDRRGVGLGLYISRAIVEGHGGRRWAENAGRRQHLLVHAAGVLADVARAADAQRLPPSCSRGCRGQSWTTMVRSEALIVRPSVS